MRQRVRRFTHIARAALTLLSLSTVVGIWVTLQSPPLYASQPDCDAKSRPGLSFSVNCSILACTFSASTAFDSTLAWDFGDLARGQGASVAHTYASAGYFLVTLTATAADGQVSIVRQGLNVGDPGPLASDDAFVTTMNTPLTISVEELLNNDAPGVAVIQIDPKCHLSADGQACTYYPPSSTYVGADSFSYTVGDAACTPASCPAEHMGTAMVTISIARPLVANPDQFQKDPSVDLFIDETQLLANDLPGPSETPHAILVSADLPLDHTSPQGTRVFRFSSSQCSGTASFGYLISIDGAPPYERGVAYITFIDPPPHAVFTVQCANRTCTVHTTSFDVCGGIQRYLWNWGDGSPIVDLSGPFAWADQTHTYAHSGRFTITHTVVDTGGQTGSLALDVVPNTPPVAANDSATTERDIPVTLDVLANDSDPDGDALIINSVDLHNYPGAAWQLAQIGGRWAIRLTPPDSFVGTMTFGYVIGDGWGPTATATVTLTVTQWTSITDALGEQFYCAQNGSIKIKKSALLANDYDSDGDVLSIIAIDTSILMGTLDCTTDPTACTYRPPSNAYGFTLFRYTVSDPAGHHDTATVRIYVGTRGSAPTLADDYFTTPRNTARIFTIQDIIQNDVDPDGDTLTVGLLSGARDFGSVNCSTPMYRCTYTPNVGFVGTDRFPYTATDSLNPQASAWINVLTLPPTVATFDAREDVTATGVNQQDFISYSFLTGNDYSPQGYPVTVASVDATGLAGSLSCDSFGCTYQPNNAFQGTTKFRYTASDGHGSTDVAIVKIRVGGSNNAPVAVADNLSTPKNTTLRFSVFDLMRNDFDPDNDPLTVTIYGFDAHKGTLSCNNPNYWCTYTPNVNATGPDSLRYVLSDGYASVTSTVTITILP